MLKDIPAVVSFRLGDTRAGISLSIGIIRHNWVMLYRLVTRVCTYIALIDFVTGARG